MKIIENTKAFFEKAKTSLGGIFQGGLLQKRNMLDSIFPSSSKEEAISSRFSSFKLLNSFDNYFYKFDSSTIYNDATIRTCIDCIAKHCAKLRPSHVRKEKGKVTKQLSVLETSLSSVLSTRPNPYMNTYDFIYKVVSQLYLNNNAFIYIKTNPINGEVISLFPIDFNSLELLQDRSNNLYCRFMFMTEKVTVPYSELIHLRRNFATHDIFGDSVNQVLQGPIDTLLTLKQSLESAVKNCTKIRGYLQLNGTMTPEDQKKNQGAFLDLIDKKTGVAVVDSKMSYNPISSDLKMADNEQLEFARQDIYRFFGLSEAIITSTYNEEQWIAFYESVIEPIAIQMGLEFTSKLFTEREKAFGNQILFETNRLEYANLTAKVNMVQVLQQTGIFTINEFREIFGFSALPDGDQRLTKLDYTSGLVTLNDTEKVTKSRPVASSSNSNSNNSSSPVDEEKAANNEERRGDNKDV